MRRKVDWIENMAAWTLDIETLKAFHALQRFSSGTYLGSLFLAVVQLNYELHDS